LNLHALLRPESVGDRMSRRRKGVHRPALMQPVHHAEQVGSALEQPAQLAGLTREADLLNFAAH
jgi:hypothetical protein